MQHKECEKFSGAIFSKNSEYNFDIIVINYIFEFINLEDMDIKEIKENLCYYDLRNPEGVIDSVLDKDELEEEGYGNNPKKDRSCDNCFYGRTDLAEELLKHTLKGE